MQFLAISAKVILHTQKKSTAFGRTLLKTNFLTSPDYYET
jgi:hypothetical protein